MEVFGRKWYLTQDPVSYTHLDVYKRQLHGGCMTELEIVLLQGDIGRDTHDEHEEGEDEIGGGEAIPLSVAQGRCV